MDEKQTKKKQIFYGVMVFYFVYAIYAVFHNSFAMGLKSTILFWAFCVLCTPIPEAGIIVDLPLKLLFNIDMLFAQCFVTLIALLITIYFYNYSPLTFKTTYILRKYSQVILYLEKYWSLFLYSLLGTFSGLYVVEWIIDSVTEDREKKVPFKSIGVCLTSIILYSWTASNL